MHGAREKDPLKRFHPTPNCFRRGPWSPLRRHNIDPSMHVAVVVLGDVGRSPRMQYHALSLLEAGHEVSLIGYTGEALIPSLVGWKTLRVYRFQVPSPKILQNSAVVYFLWRIITLSLWLSFALHSARARAPTRIDCLLVQNPPALPLLFVAVVFSYVTALMTGRKPSIVIDWHNLGYSMLSSGALRKIARVYEQTMAPWADGHLTVTEAMKEYIMDDMNVQKNVRVLYDCPPAMFQPLPLEQQHDTLCKLQTDLAKVCPPSWLTDSTESLFTEKRKEKVVYRSKRPALVTSSTSWTPDEDFGILLDALKQLEAKIEQESSDLRVVLVVTGKGPQKKHYQEIMSKLTLSHVAIQTVWLEPGDYPRLLACADLAVSLHTSTSGLDLPMKILDSFGCHVPVCAYDFAALPELVQDGENGRTFQNSEQLAEQLWELLNPLRGQGNHAFGLLEKYSRNLHGRRRWDENWTENALPVIEKAVSP